VQNGNGENKTKSASVIFDLQKAKGKAMQSAARLITWGTTIPLHTCQWECLLFPGAAQLSYRGGIMHTCASQHPLESRYTYLFWRVNPYLVIGWPI